jgi:MFS superfamily sulfate permease-like transporter
MRSHTASAARSSIAAAFGVGLFCLLAWVFRLSALVKLIGDSVLTGSRPVPT